MMGIQSAVGLFPLLPFMVAGMGDRLQPCPSGDEGEPVRLVTVWEELREREPGYRAVQGRVEAEGAARSAVLREWVPSFSFDGLGNWGQRTSPGEERVLGVGPRGDLRLVGAWTILEGGRGWRGREARFREEAAEAGREAFHHNFLGVVGRLYVEAAAAERVAALRLEERDALQALAGPIRERVAAGLDLAWESQLLEEAVARVERVLAEGEQARAGLRGELSALVGRCVRALPIEPAPGEGYEGEVGGNPQLLSLMRAADAGEAMARGEANRDRWRLQIIGSTGPTRSRAFDPGPVETEYLVGVAGSWAPDLAGVRGRLSAAEEARARALRAEAESLALQWERELDRVQRELEFTAQRRSTLLAEEALTERRLEASILRWEAGVDRWTEVIQAWERRQGVRLLLVEWEREVALALLRRGELLGVMERVPAELGQGEVGR